MITTGNGLKKPENIDDLKQAFEIFNQQTEGLTKAYQELEKEIARMNQELSTTNAKLNQKVTELDTATSYLNGILESMDGGVIAIDLSGKITTFNRFAEETCGLKRSDVLGKHYADVLKDNEVLVVSFKEVLSQGKVVFNRERDILNKKGDKIPIESSVSLLRDSTGKVRGALEVFRDLTEIKDLQQQLRRTDRLKVLGEMAATVAHEIRNPLGGIEGFALLLERDLQAQPEQKRLVGNIIEGTRSLNHFVSSLLDFTRPVKVSMVDLELSSVIDSCLLFLGCKESGKKLIYQDEKSSVVVTRKYAKKIVKINGDYNKLRQVFMNLLLNAFQAIEGKGFVSILVKLKTIKSKNTSVVQVVISDDGYGISKENLIKLFNPFFTTKEKGVGLGLATVHKIIEIHNGLITVDSDETKGTTFNVYLPAYDSKGRANLKDHFLNK